MNEVELKYLVDERRTGRTTEMLDEVARLVAEGKDALYVVKDYELAQYAQGVLDAKGIDGKRYVTTATKEFRGRHPYAVFIDNSEYIPAKVWSDIIYSCSPKIAVLAVTGKVYERKVTIG